ncbi:MAG: PDZ domain-containing protein [Lentisphaerae bacterium]|nr:PDZ domain-containing protein [Lentisphaerota bacterium]
MKKTSLFSAGLLGLLLTVSGCRSYTDKNIVSAKAPFQNIVQQAGRKVFPALVYIKVVQENLGSGRQSSASSSGSGVIISAEGEIVTNWHVIDKAVSIRCLLNDGRAFDAELIGSDKDTDLALLKLKLPPDKLLYCAEFADAAPSEGEFVMALGAPWGLNRSISIGIISCARRYLPGHSEYSLWYQTDAAISPGNSGGPLINTDGKIIGINTLGMFAAGALAFTIPADTVKVVLERLRKYRKANWAWFGLRLQPLRDFERNVYLPYQQGVLVAGTEAGSPAQRAGFIGNDLLLQINGEAITAETAEALPGIYRKLGLMEFGRKVDFTIEREGRKLVLQCAPTEKGKVEGDEVVCKQWGFTAKSINRFDNPNLHFYQPEGIFVFGVKKFSPAARGGLLKDDIILAVNNVPVKSLDGLLKIYVERQAQSVLERRTLFKVMRNGAVLQLSLYME